MAKMYDNEDPQCDTPTSMIKESKDFISHARFMTITKTFKQMLETPKVDCMIMTQETLDSLKQYFEVAKIKEPTFPTDIPNDYKLFSNMRIYIHRWLGDLIIYGDSTNKTMRQIIATCENRKDDTFHQGIKKVEVIR